MSRTKRGSGDVMHTVLVARVEEEVRRYRLFDGRGYDVSTRQTATFMLRVSRCGRKDGQKGLPWMFSMFCTCGENARRFSRGTGPATCRVLKTKEVYGDPITAWVTPDYTHTRNPWI